MRRPPGFTLIELLVVLSIAGMLAALAAPKALDLLRRSAMTKGTAAIAECAQTARILAQRHDPPPAAEPYRCFGVVVVDDGSGDPWVGVTWGANSPPLPSDLLMQKQTPWRTWAEYSAASDKLDAGGNAMPMLRLRLPSLRVHRPAPATPLADAPLSSSCGWLVQFQSGAVIATASAGSPWQDFGVDPLLILRNGSQMAAAVAVYAAGVTYAANLR